jgi:SAM-dependent methyltransferase
MGAIRAALLSASSRIRREMQYVSLIRRLRDRRIELNLIDSVVDRANGVFPRKCPGCGYTGFFRAFGNPPRWDAQCPFCGSLERHRHLALILKQTDLIRKGSDILHFAPEHCVIKLLRPLAGRHVTADLYEPGADLALDIESIDLADASFDIIVCSHILEHVDDKKALLELRRVLKHDGKLIALVPIVGGCDVTYEDPTIIEPKERDLHFRQHDHVRLYGADFRDRLAAAGFTFKELTAFGREAIEYGLLMGDKIFVCTKAGVADRAYRSKDSSPPNCPT